MTVIAWDGRILAADKRGTSGGLPTMAKKIHRLNNEILAFAGPAGQNLTLLQWYKDGAKQTDWPKFQDGEEWSYMLILRVEDKPGLLFSEAVKIVVYEKQPIAKPMLDPIMAWGSGRDFAIGAMAMGASAAEAVKIASKYDIYCGNGIDTFDVFKEFSEVSGTWLVSGMEVFS